MSSPLWGSQGVGRGGGFKKRGQRPHQQLQMWCRSGPECKGAASDRCRFFIYVFYFLFLCVFFFCRQTPAINPIPASNDLGGTLATTPPPMPLTTDHPTTQMSTPPAHFLPSKRRPRKARNHNIQLWLWSKTTKGNPFAENALLPELSCRRRCRCLCCLLDERRRRRRRLSDPFLVRGTPTPGAGKGGWGCSRTHKTTSCHQSCRWRQSCSACCFSQDSGRSLKRTHFIQNTFLI